MNFVKLSKTTFYGTPPSGLLSPKLCLSQRLRFYNQGYKEGLFLVT